MNRRAVLTIAICLFILFVVLYLATTTQLGLQVGWLRIGVQIRPTIH